MFFHIFAHLKKAILQKSVITSYFVVVRRGELSFQSNKETKKNNFCHVSTGEYLVQFRR